MLRRWAIAALEGEQAEVCIVIVDEAESADLNRRFRHREGPTNVLSFPFDPPPHVPMAFLGDVIICAPVVQREALSQNKPVDNHFAHMVVHGVLHLRGFDHQAAEQAEVMEAKEREILARLGFADPYSD
ncbi:MAG: rRNA maturation RNase YbeY [Methylohalobius sp.]|nr:rRNA maturation RNase YbeY [Methylohalobius sp.]